MAIDCEWIPFEAPCWCDDCAEHGAVLDGHTDCRAVGPSLQRWEGLGFAIRQPQPNGRWRWYAWEPPHRAGALQEAALCCLRCDERGIASRRGD